MPEVKPVGRYDQRVIRHKGVQAEHSASRRRDSVHFLQNTAVSGCVAKSEGDTGRRKHSIGKRELKSISLHPVQVFKPFAFILCHLQHGG